VVHARPTAIAWPTGAAMLRSGSQKLHPRHHDAPTPSRSTLDISRMPSPPPRQSVWHGLCMRAAQPAYTYTYTFCSSSPHSIAGYTYTRAGRAAADGIGRPEHSPTQWGHARASNSDIVTPTGAAMLEVHPPHSLRATPRPTPLLSHNALRPAGSR
jgi:hypothetical protein